MEELRTAGSRKAEKVLDVRCRRGGGADGGGIDEAAPTAEKSNGREAARRLEAPAREVAVRHRVPHEVRDGT
jgi:hypothetical protein